MFSYLYCRTFLATQTVDSETFRLSAIILFVVILLPIFTMGKYFERDGKRLLPLAIQVHHAVCDGYHVGVFVEKLQGYIDQF